MIRKFNVFLIVLLTIFLSINIVKANGNEIIDILNKFDENSFITLDDIDITESELTSIKEYFESEVVSLNEDKTKAHEVIYRWIRSNIKYGNSSNRPFDVYKNKLAVCEGYSALYKVLCSIYGIPCILVNGDTSFGAHAWNMVYLDKWIIVDLTNIGFDDYLKEDLSSYKAMYLTPYLKNDGDYLYYYSLGLSVLPLKGNSTLPNSVNGLKIDNLDIYMGYNNLNVKIDNITSLDINDIKEVTAEYFNMFTNLAFIEGASSSNGIYKSDNGYYIPKKISSITLYDEVIKKEMIVNLDEVTEIILPNVIRIEQDAIINCNKLERIVIGEKIEEIAVSLSDVTIVSDSKVAQDYAIDNNLNYSKLSIETNKTNKVYLIILGIVVVLGVCAVILMRRYNERNKEN